MLSLGSHPYYSFLPPTSYLLTILPSHQTYPIRPNLLTYLLTCRYFFTYIFFYLVNPSITFQVTITATAILSLGLSDLFLIDPHSLFPSYLLCQQPTSSFSYSLYYPPPQVSAFGDTVTVPVPVPVFWQFGNLVIW